MQGYNLDNRQGSKDLQKYYKNIEQDLKKKYNVQGINQNRFDSYFVSLLKGKQRTRELPKQIQENLSRQLLLMGADRTISESYGSIDTSMNQSMEKVAIKINNERDSRGDQSGQIQRLVRLARLHYLTRQRNE